MHQFEKGTLLEKRNFQVEPLPLKEYSDFIFKDCDFSNAQFSNIIFEDCVFIGCNMSLAKITMSSFRGSTFKDCKMLGLRFDTCSEFGLVFCFEKCILNHSSFFRTAIKKTSFKHCSLKEVDFTECILSGSCFDDCDLMRAVFERSAIDFVDFRTAYNYSINLQQNKNKKAKFGLSRIRGLLNTYDIEIDPAF